MPDADGDGLSGSKEISIGTSPLKVDTDDDFWNDSIDPFPTQTLLPNAIIAAIAFPSIQALALGCTKFL